MNIESIPNAKMITPVVAALTPSQKRAYEKLERMLNATPIVALAGDPGAGNTTVLREFLAHHDGHMIDRKEIMRVISTVPPERTDAAIMAHFELVLKHNDLVVFDNFSDLMENYFVTFPTLGYRSFHFARVLAPLMHTAVLRAGKRLVLGGRLLTPKGGTVPDPIEFLYAGRQVAVVNIEEPTTEDYARIAANIMGESKASGIEFKRVYEFASHLNCYQLSVASELLSRVEDPTTQDYLDTLNEYFVRANTRTEEVEALSFDTLPGSEEIVSRLEMQVVLPLENLELAERLDLKPKRGVLLYGPPGTGKTSIGRALAHRMKGKFFLIDGSILTDWPGNFFGKVRAIIEEAKASAPSVVFIDDADVLFTIPHIAGLPRYLLSLLDGVESETAGKVCVMMTAMDAGKIPEALLRSGRVELWLETKLPTASVRAEILKRWMVDDLPEAASVDYQQLASATDGLTPADLRRLVADAKSLCAADRVRGRPTVAANDYLLKAIDVINVSRTRMRECLGEIPQSDGANSVRVESVTAAEFGEEVLQSQLPVLVDFWAPWCGPCQSIAPVLEDLASAFEGRLKVVKLNCEENPELANSYEVRSIPRLVIFKDGEIVADQAGALDKARIEEMIISALPEEMAGQPRRAKYGLGVGGMAENGVGCKMNGW